MIDKELIELQKGNTATCCVILNEDIEELDLKQIIASNSSDSEINSIFKDISNKENLDYVVITDIDKIPESEQDRFYQIVKDREFFGHKLPQNVIIVLTVNNKEDLKKITQELYNLCVVAF